MKRLREKFLVRAGNVYLQIPETRRPERRVMPQNVTIMPPTAAPLPVVRGRRLSLSQSQPPWNVADWFVLSQTFIPAILYLPGSQPLRVPIRVASYGLSLGVLAYFAFVARSNARRAGRPHPATVWLIACVGWLCLMLLHPTTNGLVVGLAQIGMYFSIISPVLWVPKAVGDSAHLRRLLWLLLFCNGINSFVGVMQVHDPNTWMPREFSSIIMSGDFGLGMLTYVGADDHRILRPPGLSDAPGSVCGPAVFALYFGLVFAVTGRAWWQKLLAALFAALGAAAIFLSLVRSSLLIAVGMTVVFTLLQIRQGQIVRAIALLVIGFAAITGAFVHSAEIGGDSITSRFHTIFEKNPKDFYMENRGGQVAAGFSELLPKYPLGAGLGRWGMMRGYFGNEQNKDSPALYAEIQFPAWIIDGGIVLAILYIVALFVTVRRGKST